MNSIAKCEYSVQKMVKRSRAGMLPAFFKIIFQPHVDTLRIPSLFMEHFGHDLANPVVLKGPRGPAMEVKLLKSDEKAWFGKGWKDFKEWHSLQVAYLLTFHYEGNSMFRVIIYSYKSSQINYSSVSGYVDVKLENVSLSEDMSSQEYEEAEEAQSDDDLEEEEEDSVEMLKNRRSMRIKNLQGHAKHSTLVNVVDTFRMPRTEDLASSSNSSSCSVLPSFFTLIVKHDKSTLDIPPEFMRYFGHQLSKMAILKVAGGSAMEVKVMRSGDKAWFGKGWKKFREQYPLELGTLLTFYYKGNSQFCITMFNKGCVQKAMALDEEDDQENMSSDETPTSEDKTEAATVNTDEMEEFGSVEMLEKPLIRMKNTSKHLPVRCRIAYAKAVAFHGDHSSGAPYFIASMMRSYVSRPWALYVAKAFASPNIPSNCSVTLRLANRKGSEWKCYTSCANSVTRLTRGWDDFVTDNGIKEGDACLFEVDKRNKFMWNVVIFRKRCR